jgi:hypothetical protein
MIASMTLAQWGASIRAIYALDSRPWIDVECPPDVTRRAVVDAIDPSSPEGPELLGVATYTHYETTYDRVLRSTLRAVVARTEYDAINVADALQVEQDDKKACAESPPAYCGTCRGYGCRSCNEPRDTQ